jgi:hypothetical protein
VRSIVVERTGIGFSPPDCGYVVERLDNMLNVHVWVRVSCNHGILLSV